MSSGMSSDYDDFEETDCDYDSPHYDSIDDMDYFDEDIYEEHDKSECRKECRCNCELGAPCECNNSVESLLDLSAKAASQHHSYNSMERLFQQIPEPVARKFMLWSFPRRREDLHNYFGRLFQSSSRGLRDVMQIGFQVSGCYVDRVEEYDVSLCIDRCVITSASCSCSSIQEPCDHAVALAFYRLAHADTIPLNLPISDSLNSLNREQLLHLVKYIINKHSNVLLSSAQDITNELLDKNSEKNATPGAPDPTVGGDAGNPEWLKKNIQIDY